MIPVAFATGRNAERSICFFKCYRVKDASHKKRLMFLSGLYKVQNRLE